MQGKVILITGGSRGIGRAIATRLAKDNHIIIVGRTATTLDETAQTIVSNGGNCTPLVGDLRKEEQINTIVATIGEQFGKLDVLVNNASTIELATTLKTSTTSYDSMHALSARATFIMSRQCFPYLKVGDNPTILNIAPPLNLQPKYFRNHVGYAMAKLGMSFSVVAMSDEFAKPRIQVNALWPRICIATQALEAVAGKKFLQRTRSPAIMADAAYELLDSSQATGKFYLDEEILLEKGISDLSRYQMDPTMPPDKLFPSLFV